MSPRFPDRTLWPAVAVLAAVFGLFELTNLDLWVQDRLFDFARGEWIVDRAAPGPRFWFYTLPKIPLGVLGAVLIVLTWRARRTDRGRHAMVALFTLASVPLLVGAGKATTNVFCPWDITRYGGTVAYVRVLEPFSAGARPARRGHGFPAGHSSGGFALVGLAGLARSRRGRWMAIAAGIAVGSIMGAYQMAKGAHYLSHTLVTALLAWIVFLAWRRVFRVDRRDAVGADDRAQPAAVASDAAEPAVAATVSYDRQ